MCYDGSSQPARADRLATETRPAAVVGPRPAAAFHGGNPASEGSEDWRPMIAAVYEKERTRFTRYAAGCLRNSAQMGIHLAIEPADLVHDSVQLVLQGILPRSVLRCLSIEGWRLDTCIIRVISNRCAVLARRELRRTRNTGTGDSTDPKVSLVNSVDAYSEAESVLLKRWIREAVDNLPPMQREAVEQLDLRDRSVREVAEILGKSEKTLRNQRERAKQRLRRALGEHRPRLLD